MASFLPLLYALLGGVFMGTYPVPIKSKAVIEANVHPVVFQLYKSTMVFLTGFLFLIPRAIDPTLGPVSSQKQEYGELPLYIFTYWGIVSAAGWIPSGLTTIFAVPIVGVGLAVAVAAGSSSILSFLVFWLVMGEKVKTHSCGDGCTYYLAPVWLFLVVCGMVGMVLSPQFKNLPQWLGGGEPGAGQRRFHGGRYAPTAGVVRESVRRGREKVPAQHLGERQTVFASMVPWAICWHDDGNFQLRSVRRGNCWKRVRREQSALLQGPGEMPSQAEPAVQRRWELVGFFRHWGVYSHPDGLACPGMLSNDNALRSEVGSLRRETHVVMPKLALENYAKARHHCRDVLGLGKRVLHARCGNGGECNCQRADGGVSVNYERALGRVLLRRNTERQCHCLGILCVAYLGNDDLTGFGESVGVQEVLRKNFKFEKGL